MLHVMYLSTDWYQVQGTRYGRYSTCRCQRFTILKKMKFHFFSETNKRVSQTSTKLKVHQTLDPHNCYLIVKNGQNNAKRSGFYFTRMSLLERFFLFNQKIPNTNYRAAYIYYSSRALIAAALSLASGVVPNHIPLCTSLSFSQN